MLFRSVVIGNGTSAVNVTTAGTTGYPLLSGGASADPAFGQLNLSTAVGLTGTLGVANGGTGATTFAANGILYGNTTSAIQATASVNNAVLVTNGSGVPSLSTTLPAHTVTTSVTVPLVIGGSGTTGTQLTLQTTTGIGTTDAIAFKGGNNGATTFASLSSSGLTLGATGSTLGVLALSGSTSGTVTVQPAAAAGTWTLTLPTSGGTNNYVLTTNGSGTASWSQVSLTAGVTGVLPVANGGTNASSAGITAFNNITGYSAAGATGTTSTNLVFSTSPTLVTPTLGVATATSINKEIGRAHV